MARIGKELQAARDEFILSRMAGGMLASDIVKSMRETFGIKGGKRSWSIYDDCLARAGKAHSGRSVEEWRAFIEAGCMKNLGEPGLHPRDRNGTLELLAKITGAFMPVQTELTLLKPGEFKGVRARPMDASEIEADYEVVQKPALTAEQASSVVPSELLETAIAKAG